MSSTSSYRPGVCNIGAEERGRRYWIAAVAALVTAAYFAVVVGFNLFDGLLLGLFVPATFAVEAALQASRSFCITLAYRGEHAVDGGGRVTDPAARRVDRTRAATITAIAVAAGAVTTTLAFAVATVF